MVAVEVRIENVDLLLMALQVSQVFYRALVGMMIVDVNVRKTAFVVR